MLSVTVTVTVTVMARPYPLGSRFGMKGERHSEREKVLIAEEHATFAWGYDTAPGHRKGSHDGSKTIMGEGSVKCVGIVYIFYEPYV